MPFLQYQCSACGTKFEAFVSASKVDMVCCEACGGQTRRVYEGKCNSGGSASGKGASCSGSCAGCSGCKH